MTTPTTGDVLHPRIVFLLQELTASRASLRSLVDPLDDEALARVPASGGWSPLGILDHLARVEDGISRMLRKLIRDAQAAGLAAETEDDTASIVAVLAPFDVSGGSIKVAAPERVFPAPDTNRTQALAMLDDARTRLTEWLVAGSGLALGTLAAPHPVFGAMNVYQWALLVALHERRHTRQIARALDE
jgi:hypothetical protein